MKKSFQFAAISAFSALASVSSAADIDSAQLASAVRQAAYANPASAPRIVSSEVSKHPNFACEIVRAAIQGSQANSSQVAGIVRAASSASPENMRLIAQCAVATAPDSLATVQGVLAGIEPSPAETASSSTAAGATRISVPVSASASAGMVKQDQAEDVKYFYSMNNERLGRVVKTADPNHLLVVNDQGKKVGDLYARDQKMEVRATTTTAGVRATYSFVQPNSSLGVPVVQDSNGNFIATQNVALSGGSGGPGGSNNNGENGGGNPLNPPGGSGSPFAGLNGIGGPTGAQVPGSANSGQPNENAATTITP